MYTEAEPSVGRGPYATRVPHRTHRFSVSALKEGDISMISSASVSVGGSNEGTLTRDRKARTGNIGRQ